HDEGQDGEREGTGGPQQRVRGVADVGGGGGDVDAPGDAGRLQADAEVRQGRLQRDIGAERDGRHDDHGGHGVGRDVPQQDPRVGGAEGGGGLHVAVLLGGDHRAAGDPADLGPAEQHHEPDDRPDRIAGHHGEEDETAEDDRDREEDVGDPGQDRV